MVANLKPARTRYVIVGTFPQVMKYFQCLWQIYYPTLMALQQCMYVASLQYGDFRLSYRKNKKTKQNNFLVSKSLIVVFVIELLLFLRETKCDCNINDMHLYPWYYSHGNL